MLIVYRYNSKYQTLHLLLVLLTTKTGHKGKQNLA
jgi:hypothetical protein